MATGHLDERRQELERRLAALSAPARAAFESSIESPPVAVTSPAIPHRNGNGLAPLSYAQQLLWLIERSQPGHTYNVPRIARLRGSLDHAALQRAVDTLVARHAVLRTTFTMAAAEPRQVVHPAAPVAFARADLTGLPAADREPEARQRIQELIRTPFDLEHDHPFRVAVYELADDDHILVLLSHHVASDGWSGNVILRELSAYYAAHHDDQPIDLAPPAVAYTDFTTWQRDTLTGGTLDQMMHFWRQHLSGGRSQIELPTDRGRQSSMAAGGGTTSITGAREAMDRLRQIAQAEGATPFMALLAVCYALLERYTGEPDLVLATPIAGRTHPELENVVGLFANTLLLRATVDRDASFRTLLRQVRSATLQAYDHQQVPLEALMLDPATSAAANGPSLMFMTEDPGRQRFKLAGTESVPFTLHRGSSKFELSLHAADRPDGLRLHAEFRTDLFDQDTVDAMLRHYLALVASAAAEPDRALADLWIMDASERRQMLVDWNDSTAPFPCDATVHALFETQVRSSPDAIAVIADGESLTYAELDRCANDVAAGLRALGARPDRPVGICLPRSLDLIIAVLGVLKSGACYLPLDPEYPAERLALIVDDSGVDTILTQHSVSHVLPSGRATLVELTHERDTAHVQLEAPGGNAACAVTIEPGVAGPSNLAYVIYTSGSTGVPKGVEIEHRSVVNFLTGLRTPLPLDATSRFVAITPLSFDISVLELLHPLCSGAQLMIAPADAGHAPALLAELLATSGATHLQATPSTWRLLVESGWPGRPGLTALCGGEAMPQTLAAELLARGAMLWNLYGPTEATIWATLQRVTGADSPVSIGRPMANVRAYVLDAARQPVPIGVIGELYLAGEGLARGYRRRSELTAERFVTADFPEADSARLYRTGDRARWQRDGTIECLGRTDYQVKLRGHRIELGEIEHVLADVPDVAHAVVLVREDSASQPQIVAYVVARPGRSLSVAALREHVRLRLPAIMVPTSVVVLPELPLTPNGKIDRKALPRPDDQARGAGEEYVAPRITMETDAVGIWRRVLGVSRIGVHDDFFDLGGTSLLAMRMVAEVERVWGRRVPFQGFFARPTVAAMVAALIAGADTARDGVGVLQAEGVGTPLVFAHGDVLGYGWYVHGLAPLLGESPVIVLPTLGPGASHGAVSIEGMAAVHVAELRRIQPHGPYKLGGFCHGGLIAYEMARQLTAAGEQVDCVLLVDALCSNLKLRGFDPLIRVIARESTVESTTARRARIYDRLQYLRSRLRAVRTLGTGGQLRWFFRYIRRRLGRPMPAAAAPVRSGLVDDLDMDTRAALLESRAVQRFIGRAQRAYVPGRFAGRVELVFAAEALTRRPWLNACGDWDKVATRASSRVIEGTHTGIIAPEGQSALGAAMRAALDDS